MAAVRAGLSRIMLEPEGAGPEDEDASNVARIATLAIEEPTARGRALLSLAIEEALNPIAHGKVGAIRVWFVGPPCPDAVATVTTIVTHRLHVVPLGVEHVGGHGSSALFAVEKALASLADGSVDFALVAGFDVRTDAASLAAGVEAGRIIGPKRIWGYIPGEAGAAILLASERGVRRSDVRSEATLLAVASGREANPPGSTVPCLGRGLTDVVLRALDALPPNTCASGVFCDLNGERQRSDEWGFTVSRTASRLRDPGDFTTPVMAWGDCGAANGLLLLGLAATTPVRGQAADACTLVWTCSDGAERAAALVQLPKRSVPELAPLPANTRDASPAWAKDLDRGIVAEMVDECRFRHAQRAYQLAGVSGDEPPSDWGQIEHTEEILDTLAVGLAECGDPAHECARGCVDPASPETVYVATRVLLEDGRSHEATTLAVEQITAEPATEAAVLEAYLHTLRPRNPKDDRVAALFLANPSLSWVALQVAASVEIVPPTDWLARLARAVPATRGAVFLRALARIGDPSARAHLTPWLSSSESTLRREAAVAELLLGRDDARRLVLDRAQVDGSLLLPAALVVDARGAAWLLSRAKAVADVDAVLSVGMAGDPNAVPWLLDQLGIPSVASAAAAALELLLGVSCFEGHDVADEDDSAPPRRARRVSCLRSSWEKAAARVLADHPRAARLRGGLPASRAAAIALLDRPHLPPIVRQYLGYELVLRWGTTRSFDPSMPIRAQREWFSAAQRSKEPQPPGSWQVFYLGG